MGRTATIKTKPTTRTGAKISKSSASASSSKPGSKPTGVTKSKPKGKAAPKTVQKTKRPDAAPKKKKRVYTAEELGVPKLNMITPVGVEKPRGKKKGKVFVDDAESMQTILALVHAEKEGQIESKMMKARQMEEIREARLREAEAKEEARKGKLEGKKDELRKKRKRSDGDAAGKVEDKPRSKPKSGRGGKRVSFG